MSNIKKSALTIATMGLMTTACTSATAQNVKARNDTIDKPILSQAQKQQLAENSLQLAEDAREIAHQALDAAHEAMEQTHKILEHSEIDEAKIMSDVKAEVKIAMIEAEANLKEVEIELRQFNSDKFQQEIEDMHKGLDKAVKQGHLTKEDRDRILQSVEKEKKKALENARTALKEVQESLKEIRKETK